MGDRLGYMVYRQGILVNGVLNGVGDERVSSAAKMDGESEGNRPTFHVPAHRLIFRHRHHCRCGCRCSYCQDGFSCRRLPESVMQEKDALNYLPITVLSTPSFYGPPVPYGNCISRVHPFHPFLASIVPPPLSDPSCPRRYRECAIHLLPSDVLVFAPSMSMSREHEHG